LPLFKVKDTIYVGNRSSHKKATIKPQVAEFYVRGKIMNIYEKSALTQFNAVKTNSPHKTIV
jgi:hypothetical protein